MMSRDWITFKKNGLSFESKLFNPIDIEGDGNCFCHAIAASPTNCFVLRNEMVAKIPQMYDSNNTWQQALTIVYASNSKPRGLKDYSEYQYVTSLLQPGELKVRLMVYYVPMYLHVLTVPQVHQIQCRVYVTEGDTCTCMCLRVSGTPDSIVCKAVTNVCTSCQSSLRKCNSQREYNSHFVTLSES
jgi:hypothetical protein